MNIFPTLRTAAVLSVFTLSMSAYADAVKPEFFMQRFDLNNDKTITREEVQQVKTKHFAKIDANKDKQISKDEFGQTKERCHKNKNEDCKCTKVSFEDQDTNHDGHLTLEEFTRVDVMFNNMDKDNNGVISLSEVQEKLAPKSDK